MKRKTVKSILILISVLIVSVLATIEYFHNNKIVSNPVNVSTFYGTFELTRNEAEYLDIVYQNNSRSADGTIIGKFIRFSLNYS
ncbi:hypothetical protein SAMN02910263_04259 [Butyrivibrio sp. INlla16]|jgi:hypothetical protein|nr:hypothetical protein SAMN02910263_04259 [Butyrivibrio sp. INlla16]